MIVDVTLSVDTVVLESEFLDVNCSVAILELWTFVEDFSEDNVFDDIDVALVEAEVENVDSVKVDAKDAVEAEVEDASEAVVEGETEDVDSVEVETEGFNVLIVVLRVDCVDPSVVEAGELEEKLILLLWLFGKKNSKISSKVDYINSLFLLYKF